MKQISTEAKARTEQLTIGLDLGDKFSFYCVLDEAGEVEEEAKVPTTAERLRRVFSRFQTSVVALEAGTHSRWVADLLKELGHEVIVANPRQLRYLTASNSKTDPEDARKLARLARADRRLLHPVQHRGRQAQEHLTVVRVRALLVKTRTLLVNGVRGLAKTFGERLPKASTEAVTVDLAAMLSRELQASLEPLLKEIESVSEQIRKCDEQIEQLARAHYPEVRLLRQVSGVGPVIGLTFVLTIDDAGRFPQSRAVGCYLGLRPKRSSSGQSDPQLGITKAGDAYLRALLVNAAQYILRKASPDTDLKRWGLKLAGATGDKRLKKRAVVAVARKLAVLLHRLWVTGEVYEPLRNSKAVAKAA